MLLKTQSLSPDAFEIIQHKNTEKPHTGHYEQHAENGTYLCRQCGLALFRSHSKFHSGCGWPSFDDEIPNTVKRIPDADGRRTEILCTRCDAHLGHVFHGENFTAKNIRHCVNSQSLDFVEDREIKDTEEAILAAGCFWGVEYCLKKIPGVLKTEVGYTGGTKAYPTYDEVCGGGTGHVEAVRVIYNPDQIDYETLLGYFFKIHDPTQIDGQGPDIGAQYLSVIFCYDDVQENIANKVITALKYAGKSVRTLVLPTRVFWLAEEYHQNYYEKTGKEPYCHSPI